MRDINVYLFQLFLGAYVPVTKEGNIVVDGILASCYLSGNHDLGHFGMTPMRWFPSIIEWIFGEDNGIQTYVRINEYMGEWLLPHQQ